MVYLSEWRDIFNTPIKEGARPEPFLIERRLWYKGLEIIVTRLKDGATWGRALSRQEYEGWKEIDSAIVALGEAPVDEKRLLAAIGLLGGGTSTFLSALLGWKRGSTSVRLNELKKKGLIGTKLYWKTLTLKVPASATAEYAVPERRMLLEEEAYALEEEKRRA